jgi:hypothetical protein
MADNPSFPTFFWSFRPEAVGADGIFRLKFAAD